MNTPPSDGSGRGPVFEDAPAHPNLPGPRRVAEDATGRRPDPGSPGAAVLAWLVGLVALVAVAAMQQAGASAPASAPPSPGSVAQPAEVAPPSTLFEGLNKGLWRIARMGEHAATPAQAEQAERQSVQLAQQLEDMAVTPAERARWLVVHADLVDAEEAVDRWTALRDEVITADASDPLAADIDVFILRTRDPAAPLPDGFADRHGFFAELLLALDDADARQALAGPERTGVLAVVLIVQFAIIGLAFVAGLVLLGLGIVQFASGTRRPRFRPPTRGGSVYLEMVAVFIAGFLLLKLVLDLVAPMLTGVDPLVLTGITQWLLVAVLFWPKLRGAPHAARDLGWSAPPRPTRRGTKPPSVAAEVVAGFVGYLACLPLYLAGVLVTLLVVLVQGLLSGGSGGGGTGGAGGGGGGADPSALPENPLIDLVSGGSVAGLIAIAVLATLWAPIVEETVFRGGMYRHLRSRVMWLVAALFSAIVFGLMHGYPIAMLGPVVALGVGFAMLREWRGSIIAPVVAHAIHNGFVFGVLLTAVSLFN